MSSKKTIKRLIAISGGIGSGKSVVSEMLRIMGYKVYDSDSRAKHLMDTSDLIKQRIAVEIGYEAVANSMIDRRKLAEMVFCDELKLERLNRIVHSAVRNDIVSWCDENSNSNTLFVETAILYQSELDRMVDEVWEVCAPIDIRIQRVARRSGLSKEQTLARINAQESFVPENIHPSTKKIVNDGRSAILPEVLKLLKD